MEVNNAESFIEQLADAVVKRIDEREKINIIAEAVIERLREMESKGEQASTSLVSGQEGKGGNYDG